MNTIKKTLLIVSIVGALTASAKMMTSHGVTSIPTVNNDADLNTIAECWNAQAYLANRSYGVNNPYFMQAVIKGHECKERQKDFERKYDAKPRCVLDRYGSYECKA